MKKALKQTLAILLATLMALGAATVASAAPTPDNPTRKLTAETTLEGNFAPALQAQSGAALTIDTQPTNTSYVLEYGYPDATGLVVTLTDGDFGMQIAYGENYIVVTDDFWSYATCGVSTYRYDAEMDEYETIVTGPGTFNLTVYAHYADSDGNVHYAETTCPYTVTSILNGNTDNAAALVPGGSVMVTLTQANPYSFYKFTPETTGMYSFASSDRSGTDPKAYLYDDSFAIIADSASNENYDDLNFDIVAKLTAGKTYYFAACSYSGEDVGSYKVTVQACKPVELPATYSMYYHATLESALDSLLKDTGWSRWELKIEYDAGFFQYFQGRPGG
jgi:hypothetical protein